MVQVQHSETSAVGAEPPTPPVERVKCGLTAPNQTNSREALGFLCW